MGRIFRSLWPVHTMKRVIQVFTSLCSTNKMVGFHLGMAGESLEMRLHPQYNRSTPTKHMVEMVDDVA